MVGELVLPDVMVGGQHHGRIDDAQPIEAAKPKAVIGDGHRIVRWDITDAFRAAAGEIGATIFHPVGTAKMGPANARRLDPCFAADLISRALAQEMVLVLLEV
jgi:choline dehydrogenase-like flavoprotein